MKIEDNRVVSIHYVLTNDEGETLDSSDGKDPLTYLHGTGSLIPGLERELAGKMIGDELDAVIAPSDAYGEQDDALIRAVSRSAFEGVESLEPGMQFQASGENDAVQVITVVKVEEDLVTVDANHPLAGVTLNFSVKIEDVREATGEEISHGHVH
jgi:FKBP-type peptidyl-prolyl cis-trans isomerase SlyD